MFYLPINLVHWSFSSPSVVFLLTCCRSEPLWDALCDASVNSSSPSYCSPLVMIRSSPPRLACLDLNIIKSWWLHLDQYIPKVYDLYLRTNLNFLIVFFILIPPRNSIDLTSSSSSRALKFWQTPSSLIPIVACITQDTISTMILIVGKYKDPHRWL